MSVGNPLARRRRGARVQHAASPSGAPSASMEEEMMYDPCNSTRPSGPVACDDTGGAGGTSRRQLLKAGAGIAAAGGAAQMWPTGTALAQGSGPGNSDPELAR